MDDHKGEQESSENVKQINYWQNSYYYGFQNNEPQFGDNPSYQYAPDGYYLNSSSHLHSEVAPSILNSPWNEDYYNKSCYPYYQGNYIYNQSMNQFYQGSDLPQTTFPARIKTTPLIKNNQNQYYDDQVSNVNSVPMIKSNYEYEQKVFYNHPHNWNNFISQDTK